MHTKLFAILRKSASHDHYPGTVQFFMKQNEEEDLLTEAELELEAEFDFDEVIQTVE